MATTQRSRPGISILAAILLLSACDDGGGSGGGSGAGGPIPDGPDLSGPVLQVCAESLPHVDCACFWEHAKAAFTAGNLPLLAQALAERSRWGAPLTRVRMEKAAGTEAARLINRALYACTRP